MLFKEKLHQAWKTNNSFLCIGLDPDLSKIPSHLLSSETPLFDFNRAIIDATAEFVCAYKPQIAYYSAQRAEAQLEMTIQYIKKNYPDLLVILDAKRNDIGPTAEMYAIEAFDRYEADAVTVNPLLGRDSITPFLVRPDKAAVLLCRTSNPSAIDFQNFSENEKSLSEYIAEKTCREWNYNSNIMLVVGATYPKELKQIRKIAGKMPFLVPGVGTQRADIETAVRNGMDSDGLGIVLSSSRSIIYASKYENYAELAAEKAKSLHAEIQRFRF